MHPEAVHEKLGIDASTPELYDALGIILKNGPSSITPEQVSAHYHAKKPTLSKHFPADERAHFEKAHETLSNPERKAIYDKHVYPTFYSPELEASAQSSIARGLNKLSIRNPAVSIGAAVLATAATYMGIKATKRISVAKDEGSPATANDRALQAIGFSGAASVIGMAALMWNASKGRA